MSRAFLCIFLSLQIIGVSEAVASGCGPTLSQGRGQNASAQSLRKRKNFPKSHQVSKSDWALREALWEVSGGYCFYEPWVKLNKDTFEVDHIWPESWGGPDNIFNFVPTTKRFNIWKSNHLDPVAIDAWLAKARNQFAERVYQRYLELKNGAAVRNLSAREARELEELVQNAAGLTTQQRRQAKMAVLKLYQGPNNQVVRFARQFLAMLSNLPARQRSSLKEGRINFLVKSLSRLEILERKFKISVDFRRSVRKTLANEYLGNYWLQSLDQVTRARPRFSSFAQSVNLIERVASAVEVSHKERLTLRDRVSAKFGLGVGRTFKPPHKQVFDLVVEISEPSQFHQDSQIKMADYLSGLDLLAPVFVPEKLKPAFQLTREIRIDQKLKGFVPAARLLLRARVENPSLTLPALRKWFGV